MGQRLAHLHDAHDGRVDLVLPVLEDALLRRLLLLVLSKKKPQKNIHRFDWPRLKKKAKLEAVSKRRKTHGLFELDLVDFDAAQFEGEVAVVGELVAVADVLAARRLLQHPRLAARQRLQRPPQLGVLFQRSTSNNNISSSRQSHFSIQLVL